MNQQISVDPAELNITGKNIASLGGDYKTNITKIYTEIDNLSTKWTGGASEKYITACNSYKNDLNKLGDAIVGMGNGLQTAGQKFSDNEEDLLSQAGRL